MGSSILDISLLLIQSLLTSHQLPDNVQYSSVYREREEGWLVCVGSEIFDELLRFSHDDVIQAGLAHAHVPEVAQQEATQSLPLLPVPEDDS